MNKTMLKKMFFLLPALLCSVVQGAWAWDGAGTQSDPWLIRTSADLDEMATHVNSGENYSGKYFKVVSDIAYSHSTEWNAIGTYDEKYWDGSHEDNYAPIGNKNYAFRGKFDGNGHTISGIRVYPQDVADESHKGLFGHVGDGASIHDLTLTDTYIAGWDYTGGIVGYKEGGTVTDCIVSPTVAIRCKNYGNGHGGIVGCQTEGTIANCISSATLVVQDTRNCAHYGGIVGRNEAASNEAALVKDNLAIGVTITLATSGDTYGAICGQAANTAYLMYNYYQGCTIAGSTTGVGCHRADISSNDGAMAIVFENNGSSRVQPYVISSATRWNIFAYYVNNGVNLKGKYVKLTADISVSTMVGNSEENSFQGTFLGDGVHTLTFTRGTAESNFNGERCAPFRYVKNATIKDLKVAGDIYTSAGYAAGLVAECYGTTNITGCAVSTNIYSTIDGDGTHGGIVAMPSGTLNIAGCAYTGRLLTNNSTNNCGGFVAWHNSATISITNSLYAPSGDIAAGWTAINAGATFVRGGSVGTGCYYTGTMGDAQGTQAYAIATAPGNLGDAVEDVNYGYIKAYANGLLYGGKYYVAPAAITLTDTGTNDVDGIDGYFANVTLQDRTLYKDGEWNTLCLPFNVVLDGSPLDGAEARPLESASISGTTLNLTFGDAVTTLVAGTPYIIKWASGEDIVSPVFSGVVIDKTDRGYDNGQSGNERVQFLGTYTSRSFSSEDKSILFMGDGNKLYYPLDGASIGAQRAYFKIGDSTAAPSLTDFSIDFGGGETTAITTTNLTNRTNSADAWYTLDGRRLSQKPAQRGIYINNGHKVVIK